jgi:hypothetical protein
MLEVAQQADSVLVAASGLIGLSAGWFWGAMRGYANGWVDGKAGSRPELTLFLDRETTNKQRFDDQEEETVEQGVGER